MNKFLSRALFGLTCGEIVLLALILFSISTPSSVVSSPSQNSDSQAPRHTAPAASFGGAPYTLSPPTSLHRTFVGSPF